MADLGVAYQSPVDPGLLRAAREPTASADVLREAATVYATSAPGVGSYAALRAGLGWRSELTVAAINTTLRVGARKELYAEGNWVCALGAHLRAGSLANNVDRAVSGLSVESSRVFGGDVMFFGGYLRRNIYDFWFGPRLGVSWSLARLAITSVQPGAFEVSAWRLDASFVFGARVNFGHIAVGMEIDLVHTWLWGFDGRGDVAFKGLSLIPASAVSYQF